MHLVLGLNFATAGPGRSISARRVLRLGAYANRIATKAGLPWIATPFFSVVIVTACKPRAWLPTLRLRTYYLAMTTNRLWEIIRLIIVHWEPVTGGTSGLRAIPGISVFGLAPQGQIQHYYLLIAVLALAVLVRGADPAFVARARHDRDQGFRDRRRASGVDTTRIKLLAFTIGAVYAGLAGCLYASSIRFISPDSFSGTQAVLLMTMLIVGGMGSIAGCIIGAVALTILPEALRFMGQWYWCFTGSASSP